MVCVFSSLTVETQVAQVSLVIENLRIIDLRIVRVNEVHVIILFAATSIASNLSWELSLIRIVQIHDSALLSVGWIDSENTRSSTNAKNHFLLLKVVILRGTVWPSSRLVWNLEVFVSVGRLTKGCVLIWPCSPAVKTISHRIKWAFEIR